ncbi:MAG: deoxyguanosinetriphosphate triphosphohydrolase [Candidatus Aerophobetes bacterium]|nr:deoxyguanosinetriphosphate triphosphohydrolase [Candidatus Aerophobetes bacterium]
MALPGIFDRISQEKWEEEFLSPYASKSRQSKGRERKEISCPLRTEYQRDRDRIIHSKAFRRLKHKTQVFIAPFGDHYRTRLTHTLEVSQIARTIARAIYSNEDLTEAIALGHDLGHTPFGHTGEDALNDVHLEGFRHNEQSLHVVEKLEGEGGLNLTWEVRDGILNHSQDREKVLDPETKTHPHTLEGEVVKVADSLAYVNHDIDDALRAGIIRKSDLPSRSLEILGRTHRERINTLVQDIVRQNVEKPHLAMNREILESFNELRDFMYEQVYLSPVLAPEIRKAYEVVTKLYDFYLKHIDLLPASLKKNIEKEGKRRAVVDYIAGMTDQYALSQYKTHFVPRGWL